MKNRKTKTWEKDVINWMKRHEIPEEKIALFIPFLWRKVQIQELEAMRSVIREKV